MRATLPTELLLKLMHASAEQMAQVERILAAVSISDEIEKPAPVSHRGVSFAKVGDHWKVLYGGRELHLADSLGARYLDYLVRHPNRPVSALDLELAITPEKAGRGVNSRDAMLDSQAVRECLREMERLRAEREEAVEDGDHARAEEIDDELEQLEQQIKGRNRVSDSGERARNNVRKAIGAVVKALLRGDAVQKAFGEHLRDFVSTGYECVYRHTDQR